MLRLFDGHSARQGLDVDDDQLAGRRSSSRCTSPSPRRRACPWRVLEGTLQNDILKEYIAQKEWIYPPRPSLRIITDLMGFCAERVPKWNTISISGYHIREAGSTAVQELAFTIADGIGYVQAGIEAGLDVDVFAPRLSFFFNSHNDFFEEIAKMRAARRLWAQHHARPLRAKNPRSWMLRFHTQTAGCSLTAQQPYNNIVRVTVQALAAVLGGTQSLHTNSLDETLALPTQEAVTIALRTQQILAEESGVANTIDPLAGSYFVEALTDRMEAEAQAYIDKIDALGGIVAAIETGFPQKEIADASYRYQQQIDRGEKSVVGVNKHVAEDEKPHRDPADLGRGRGRAEGAPGEDQGARATAGPCRRAPRRASRAGARAARTSCR